MDKRKMIGPAAVLIAAMLLTNGCTGDGGGGILEAGLPPQAIAVEEGQDQLVYVANQPGRLYLYDATDDDVVGVFNVRPGQRFAVDVRANRATLAGNEVSVAKLRSRHTYRIYLMPQE